jgi:MFS family permease
MSQKRRTDQKKGGRDWHYIQRRSSPVDHLKPYRWNWHLLVRPLDQSLERQVPQPITSPQLRGLRYFWLDGLFAVISESFYLSFVPLFALAYGATNGQVGLVTAAANLMGALSLFPGARLVEKTGKRKAVVVWTGGGLARLALLGLAIIPFFIDNPTLAIGFIIAVNGIRALAANLGNPAWTALVADLVPDAIRGRYFGSRNTAMGLAALLIAPLAGLIIRLANNQLGWPYLGYQSVFLLSFLTGMVATISFNRIPEPKASRPTQQEHHRGDLRQALRRSPTFIGLISSAFIWNLALQIAAPFFNVYLVSEFGASTTTIGFLASVSSLTALAGQQVFGRLMDRKSAYWVQLVCGFSIPLLPLAWMSVTAPWQVAIINSFGGLIWAGYNLSNFNLLLQLAPDEQRPRAVALYQTAVFSSAVLGPFLGGYLADAVSFKLLFGLSGIGRAFAMVIFLVWVVRPRHVSQT